MQELLDAFLRALKSEGTRMAEGEVRLFLEHFPGELAAEDLSKIRELTRQRFGKSVTETSLNNNPFAADGAFSNLVPQTGFINKYLKYTQNLEAPLEFQFFCAIALMGQVVGRRQYIERGAYTIYPPTPLILVAPSGVCRKTSAVQLAVKLARTVEVPVLANKVTPEDFVRQLQDTHKGASPLISAPELSVLIGKQKYNVGLIEILTDLLDCPDYWESGTIMRGRTELHNVTLGLLGASTPKWLKTSIPVEAFAGGFMSRLILIVKENTPRIFPSPPPLNKQVWGELVEWLVGLQSFEGEVALEPDASLWYDKWYREQKKEIVKAGEDNVGYFSRKPDHLLRLALNLQISRGERSISTLALEEANDVFSWIDTNTPIVIKMLLSTEHGAVATTIIQMLKKGGGHVPKKEVLRNLTKQFTPRLALESIQTLFATEQIGRYDGGQRVGDVFFLKDWGED